MSSSKPSILTIGLNPALQKRLLLPKALIPGNVHRIKKIETGMGGKGQDVSITLSCLSIPSNVLQFIGEGENGDTVLNRLREHPLRKDWTLRVQNPTRVCTTLISESEETELVEPSGVVRESEVSSLLELANERGKMDAVCVMGSMPPGCPTDTYAKLIDICSTENTLILLDTVIGLKPLTETLSRKSRSCILKINFAELCRLVDMEGSESSSCGRTEQEVKDVVNQFLKKFESKGISFMAITDGKHPAFSVRLSQNESSFRVWKMNLIELQSDQPLYPIGAGDAVAAGTIAAWQMFRTMSEFDHPDWMKSVLLTKFEQWKKNSGGTEDDILMAQIAFGFGLACGSASCLQCENSVLKVEDVLRLFEQMDCPVKI